MSADNGIYILESISASKEKDGTFYNVEPYKVFRVAYTQGFDQFYYLIENQPYNAGAYLYEIFKDSDVYLTLHEANDYALEIYKSIDYVEYGITLVNTKLLSDNFIFYGDM